MHLLLLLLAPACALQRFERTRVVMGTHARVVLYAKRPAAARRALDVAFDRLDELEHVMSDYRPDSELMRLCERAGGPPQEVSFDLWTVLVFAIMWAENTEGAFDPTVGPYVRQWRKARKNGVLPTDAELAEARRRVGWQHIRLDQGTVQLTRPGMMLDLGGIGKGYAADDVVRLLQALGHDRCLVDLGGDIVVGAAPPDREGWRIQVAGQEHLLAHRGIASSGDTERFVEIGGVRYSHIVDPRTGLGLTHRMRVTVVARSGTEADALASAISVRPDLRPAGVEVYLTVP